MNDINNNKTNLESQEDMKNQEAITGKTESDISDSLSRTPLTPDQKMDKIIEGMNNMTNGMNQILEVFKQMVKVQIETSATTNKMITEEKNMIEQLFESNTKQLIESNKEQTNIINEFIAEEAKKREEKKILDELQEYWEMDEDIKSLLKEVYISGYINQKNEDGDTLLHLAVNGEYTEMVKILLKHPKINVRIENSNAESAEYIANCEWYTEIVKIIKNHRNNNK